MSERFCLDVECFLAGKHVENLLVDLICLGEVGLERLFDVGVGSEHGFRAEGLMHCLRLLHGLAS